jgi:hypothetical protein
MRERAEEGVSSQGYAGARGVSRVGFWNGGGNKVRFSEGMVGDDGSAKVLQ